MKIDFDRTFYKNLFNCLKTGFVISLFLVSNSISQAIKNDTPQITKPVGPLEIKNDDFVRVSKENQKTSPAYYYSTERFFVSQVNVNSNGENIIGDAANEPSIAVDPNDASRMAIGWRQFETIGSSFRQAGYGYTTNGGQSWIFPGSIESGIFRSDPVLDSDSEGNFYYNSLSVSPYTCHVFKSSDGGINWDSGTFAQGGDKQWMAIDKTVGQGKGNIYAYWTYAYSLCDPDFFTRSVDNGRSFEECITIPNEPYWGTLDVGPDGELYAVGFGGPHFLVTKSSNAKFSQQDVIWDFTRNVDLSGEIMAFDGNSPNPGGLLGQAWIAVDKSNASTRGNVYVLCSVKPYFSSDPLDVMFAHSTDGGSTWSSPVKINDDDNNNAWQWFGTMSVAPNGRIDVVWLDTRDDPGGVNSALYYSYSSDAGITWESNEQLSDSFNPHLGWPQQQKMGDYFHMVSEDDKIHLAWAATFNGGQDVFYGRIIPDATNINEETFEKPNEYLLLTNYPNPFNGQTTIKYNLPYRTNVKIELYNVQGQKIKTLLQKEEGAGYNTVSLNSRDLESGVYFYRLSSELGSIMKKLVVLK